jgi:hypothetical protein
LQCESSVARREEDADRLASSGIVSQHRAVTGRKLARALALPLGVLCGAFAGACDSTVTSIGAWEPITMQPEAGGGQGATAGGGGGAGSGGVAAMAGVGAGGMLVGDAGAGGSAGEPASPGVYLEAEAGELSGPFSVGADVAASNGQFIQAPPTVFSDSAAGAAHARYQFEVPADASYVIWGRIFSPDTESNRFWFQLDGGEWIKWRMTVGAIWYWHFFNRDTLYDQVLRFPLTAGTHVLEIANDAPDTKLDRLYITSAGDEPPGNDTKCHPPHSIDPGGGGDCKLSCGVQAPQGMHASCACGTRTDVFPAYDCGGGPCCVIP